jgi:hypothetical protein
MSRATVRQQVASYVKGGFIEGLNQVFTSFPKRINFQTNSMPGEDSRAACVVFIENETESRIAIGGAHSGWKRVDYGIVLQIYHHSSQKEAEMAMSDFDSLIDCLKDYLRADHNLGDPTGNIVWQGAEPAINTSYGEPATSDGGVTETQAIVRFIVTEMIQA